MSHLCCFLRRASCQFSDYVFSHNMKTTDTWSKEHWLWLQYNVPVDSFWPWCLCGCSLKHKTHQYIGWKKKKKKLSCNSPPWRHIWIGTSDVVQWDLDLGHSETRWINSARFVVVIILRLFLSYFLSYGRTCRPARGPMSSTCARSTREFGGGGGVIGVNSTWIPESRASMHFSELCQLLCQL